jgi:hypothetical protein
VMISLNDGHGLPGIVLGERVRGNQRGNVQIIPTSLP